MKKKILHCAAQNDNNSLFIFFLMINMIIKVKKNWFTLKYWSDFICKLLLEFFPLKIFIGFCRQRQEKSIYYLVCKYKCSYANKTQIKSSVQYIYEQLILNKLFLFTGKIPRLSNLCNTYICLDTTKNFSSWSSLKNIPCKKFIFLYLKRTQTFLDMIMFLIINVLYSTILWYS